MLGEPGDRVTEFVGEPPLLRDLRKDFGCRLLGLARPHQIEDSEFHFPLLSDTCSGSKLGGPRYRGHALGKASKAKRLAGETGSEECQVKLFSSGRGSDHACACYTTLDTQFYRIG